MLLTLLLILKILLITVGIILALAVGIVLAVLLIPIRYRVLLEGNTERLSDDGTQLLASKKLKLVAGLKWFMSLFAFNIAYDDGALECYIRVLFFKIRLGDKKETEDVGASRKSDTGKRLEAVQEPVAEKRHKQEPDIENKNKPEKEPGIEKRDKLEKESSAEKNNKLEKETVEEKKHKNKIKNTKEASIGDKINRIKENVTAKLRKIKDLVDNEDYKKLVAFLWGQLCILIGKIKPSKGRLYLHYGFEDIETTGKVAMYAAMCYGIIGKDIEIIPDFENKVCEGSVFAKGSIRVLDIVIIAVRCFRNKLVKKYILTAFR